VPTGPLRRKCAMLALDPIFHTRRAPRRDVNFVGAPEGVDGLMVLLARLRARSSGCLGGLVRDDKRLDAMAKHCCLGSPRRPPQQARSCSFPAMDCLHYISQTPDVSGPRHGVLAQFATMHLVIDRVTL